MKIRRIYNESSNITDLSKDRIHLNLSYNEWKKIQNFIDFVRWELPKGSRLQKQAENIHNSLMHIQELEPIWTDNKGRV